MKDFKREDYIYVRLLCDYKSLEGIQYQEGDILRFKKECLKKDMMSRHFKNVFDVFNIEDVFEMKKRDNVSEDTILLHKIYDKIILKKGTKAKFYVWTDSYFYLNDWFKKHVNERGIDCIKYADYEVKPFIKENNIDNESFSLSNKEECPFIYIKEGCADRCFGAEICFSEGEELDFTNSAVAYLFYEPGMMRLFANAEVITGEEKESLFQSDFGNAILALEDENSFSENKQEFHYFKMKDEIKVRNKKEMEKIIGAFLDFNVYLVYNEEGYVDHVYTMHSLWENSNRIMEQRILKVALPMTKEEAILCRKNEIKALKQQEMERYEQFTQELEEKYKRLEQLYNNNKNDTIIFPGMNGYFVHNIGDGEKRKFSLQEIQNFYRNLKKLDPSVVKDMCFYGGTVPYILTHANESRTFGDIDIFMPMNKMEDLRRELKKQDDFVMLRDSIPLCIACDLTTRIPISKKDETSLTFEDKLSSLCCSLTSLFNEEKVKVDEFGNFLSPQDERRGYILRMQDFGFKGNLFGVTISVFPMYEYKGNIVSKSFNDNGVEAFLLGVKVLNNEQIGHFVKTVSFDGVEFKIIPFEYTLISKKSAVDGQYSKRMEKDAQDIAYITEHWLELGIDQKVIEDYCEKYPDYSISIAYRVNPDGTTKTMHGETYKEYVLTNRRLS